LPFLYYALTNEAAGVVSQFETWRQIEKQKLRKQKVGTFDNAPGVPRPTLGRRNANGMISAVWQRKVYDSSMIFRPPQFWVWLVCAGCLSGSALAADTQPPDVAITQPTTGATLAGNATVVQVTAADASGLTEVVLKIDGGARRQMGSRGGKTNRTFSQ
jgi:hypothetical protein